MAIADETNQGAQPVAQQTGATAMARPLAEMAARQRGEYQDSWLGKMPEGGSAEFVTKPMSMDMDNFANAWNEPQTNLKAPVPVDGVAGAMPVAMQGPAADRAASYEGAWNEVAPAAAGAGAPAGALPAALPAAAASATPLPAGASVAGSMASPSASAAAPAAAATPAAAANAPTKAPAAEPAQFNPGATYDEVAGLGGRGDGA